MSTTPLSPVPLLPSLSLLIDPSLVPPSPSLSLSLSLPLSLSLSPFLSLSLSLPLPFSPFFSPLSLSSELLDGPPPIRLVDGETSHDGRVEIFIQVRHSFK